jgi:tRNA pseudouridine38-40 synthase
VPTHPHSAYLNPSGEQELKRIALGLQYDGAPWHGWQTQLSRDTVQDRLEAALRRFTTEEINTVCAGRTDSGVHALEQVVHFDTEAERDQFSWVRGVNSFLPPSIAVRWACEAAGGADGFHARFSATARTYQYLLYNHPVRSPLLTGRAGWVFRPLDVEAMQLAATALVGQHDFSAFRAIECQARTPVRTMHALQVRRDGNMVVFTIKANAFLHHMVRNIVGSLIYVGMGRKPPAWLREVLEGADRSVAAPTFMPDGLYLAKIDYDDRWRLPQQQLAQQPSLHQQSDLLPPFGAEL